LKGGFVMPGGALCMEVLTPHGWTPATSIESLLVTVGIPYFMEKYSCFHILVILLLDKISLGRARN
jgi:hypothetical protein